MKKFMLYLLASFLVFTFIPNEARATTSPIKTELQGDPTVPKTNLISRLDEIKTKDRLNLNANKRNVLRNETRKGPGGIYISVGALILIIILLIIIF